MKIVKIVPGSGGTFYCENCLRDTALIAALQRADVNVVMVPMYLPLLTDGAQIDESAPVFFGGINVYLQQKLALFRHTPRWVDRVFDSRPLLKLAAAMEGTTKANGMGSMTLSMIRGEEGSQAKELERLVSWLGNLPTPDAVHISTIMLVGLARRIKQELGVPVICSVQDEDVWLDYLDEPYNRTCWDAIAERTEDVDAVIAPSVFYGQVMKSRLGLDETKLHTVLNGIDLDGYRVSDLERQPPVLGYLSKMTPSLGLGKLVDAFTSLKNRPGLDTIRLRAMGGILGGDKKYVSGIRKQLAAEGCGGDADFLPEMDRASRLNFLSSLSVMSVPIPGGEALGTFVLEAWAAGVPVVEPRAGGFVELIEETGGGLLYEEDDPDGLANGIARLLTDRSLAKELGDNGRRAVLARFGVDRMAEEVVKVYDSVVRAAAADAVDHQENAT